MKKWNTWKPKKKEQKCSLSINEWIHKPKASGRVYNIETFPTVALSKNYRIPFACFSSKVEVYIYVWLGRKLNKEDIVVIMIELITIIMIIIQFLLIVNKSNNRCSQRSNLFKKKGFLNWPIFSWRKPEKDSFQKHQMKPQFILV